MNNFMLPNVDAKVELLFSGYEVTGFAAIRCWDDSECIICFFINEYCDSCLDFDEKTHQ